MVTGISVSLTRKTILTPRNKEAIRLYAELLCSGRHARHLHDVRTCACHLHIMWMMSACHLHNVRMTFVCRLHVIHTSKSCMSCLISCSTTPDDMNGKNFFSIGIDIKFDIWLNIIC